MIKFITFIKAQWIALTVALLLIITFLSLWPLPEFPDMPGNDKSGHLIAYAILMLPVAIRRPKHWLLCGFLFIAFSGIIELIQPFVNRYGEWLDLAANTTGIFLGTLAGTVIHLLSSHQLPGPPRSAKTHA